MTPSVEYIEHLNRVVREKQMEYERQVFTQTLHLGRWLASLEEIGRRRRTDEGEARDVARAFIAECCEPGGWTESIAVRARFRLFCLSRGIMSPLGSLQSALLEKGYGRSRSRRVNGKQVRTVEGITLKADQDGAPVGLNDQLTLHLREYGVAKKGSGRRGAKKEGEGG
jgi:hypothetical protein